jgi:arylsulfatase A-like enzyme
MSTGKPNILVIMTDTQRCDTLSFMGNLHAVSPNIDRLAREGVYFRQAHTSSPVCMPARCSFLTGLHTPVHGCIENGFDRREDQTTLPDLMKAQGYTNIMVGKTHFGPVPAAFDIRHLSVEKPLPFNDAYTEHLKKHGFDRARDHRHPTPIPEDIHMEAWLADRTIESIERVRQEGKKPFFAIFSMFSPHAPIDPPGKWAHLYNNLPLPEINYQPGEENNQPPMINRLLGLGPFARPPRIDNLSPEMSAFADEIRYHIYDPANLDTLNKIRRHYYGLAAYCDAQVGRVLGYLDSAGLCEETLVIFTSDHGQQYWDHGFNNKHSYYDASWRVPLVMSMPGTLPQETAQDFAIWNDLTATVLGAAGTTHQPVQGFDLFTPLTQGKESPRRCGVGTLFTSCALATRRWKLEYYLEEGDGRLFDKRKDPLERNDLYNNHDYKEVRDKLLQALLTWRAGLTDVEFLTQAKSGLRAAPVAQLARRLTADWHGCDGEQRLNEAAERIDGETEGL